MAQVSFELLNFRFPLFPSVMLILSVETGMMLSREKICIRLSRQAFEPGPIQVIKLSRQISEPGFIQTSSRKCASPILCKPYSEGTLP